MGTHASEGCRALAWGPLANDKETRPSIPRLEAVVQARGRAHPQNVLEKWPCGPSENFPLAGRDFLFAKHLRFTVPFNAPTPLAGEHFTVYSAFFFHLSFATGLLFFFFQIKLLRNDLHKVIQHVGSTWAQNSGPCTRATVPKMAHQERGRLT